MKTKERIRPLVRRTSILPVSSQIVGGGHTKPILRDLKGRTFMPHAARKGKRVHFNLRTVIFKVFDRILLCVAAGSLQGSRPRPASKITAEYTQEDFSLCTTEW